MGISNRLPPNNVDVTRLCDVVSDPNDNTPDSEGLEDVDHFARFMRATKMPPRDKALAASSDGVARASLFHSVGCDFCHVSSITTAPAGTAVAAGAFIVPDSLGNKIIHPYSDFLLHNIGTGDGIVQTGGQETANKMRTPPLWGVRTRTELLHDGRSATFFDAIQRHGGEAQPVTNKFQPLEYHPAKPTHHFPALALAGQQKRRGAQAPRWTFTSHTCRFVTAVALCENAFNEDP